MKKITKLLFITSLSLLMILLPACNEDYTLKAPSNIKVDVTLRVMTITWDVVPNALGYEIHTTSIGCASGNRIINTKENTATAHNGTTNTLFNDGRNGAVQIVSPNKVEITLMPMTPGSDEPMPSAVTAKIKALGGTVNGQEYLDSEYSAVITLNKAEYN